MSQAELEHQYEQTIAVIQELMERAEFIEDLMHSRDIQVPRVLDNGDTNDTIQAKEYTYGQG